MYIVRCLDYTHTHTPTLIHTHTLTHTHLHPPTHTSTPTHTHIYTHTHIHTYVITIPLNYTNRLPIASNTKGENSPKHHQLDGINYPLRNKNLMINTFKKKLKQFLLAQH